MAGEHIGDEILREREFESEGTKCIQPDKERGGGKGFYSGGTRKSFLCMNFVPLH